MASNHKNRIRLSRADKVYQVCVYTLVTIVTLTCLLPLLYVIGMSFTTEGEMIERNYFVIVPTHPTLKAYQYVFQKGNIFHSMLISLCRTVLGVMAMLAFVIPGGYVLAKKDLEGRGAIMIFFIITMLIGGGIIPSYILLRDLGLINSFWVYIVPAFGGTYNMLIVKLFVEGIPRDIIESADLDGASEVPKMLNIAVPLLVPTIMALSLFSAVGHWNSWFDVLLYVRDVKIQPVAFRIREMMTQISVTDTQNGTMQVFEKPTSEGVKMASVVVAIVPILLVYPFIQKYFIYGMYTGSVKG